MSSVAAERLNASTLLDRSLDAGRGAADALITASTRVSYDELAGLTAAVAAYLGQLGVQREQRVLMLLDDCPEFVATFLGAMRIGAVPVPVNPMDRLGNHVYYLEDSYARVLVIDHALGASLDAMLAARPALHVVVVDGEGGRGVKGGEDGEARAASSRSIGGPGPSQHPRFSDVIAPLAGPLEAPADTHRDDMAFWLYSSGSTGRPKGVVHAHRDIRVTVDQYARNVLRIDDRDRCYSTTKLFHAYGLGNSLSFPLSVGASSVLRRGRALPAGIFETVASERPSLFFSVPALYAAMLKAADHSDQTTLNAGRSDPATLNADRGSDTTVDFSSVRGCVSAAEALPAAILARWRELTGVPILDGVGSTEMLHIYCSNTFDDVVPGTSGRPVPGYELRVLDEHGGEAPAGVPGDLLVRGDSCASFYWHQREKSRFCMRGEWFFTGDRYVATEDGHYSYQGRADDMIKAGGLWVSPADVEACLVQHHAVSEAAVIGVRVDDLSRIKAFVICSSAPPDPIALADELRSWCKSRLRRYEYPHVIEFVEDLPRTATGKVQRFKLREAERARAAPLAAA